MNCVVYLYTLWIRIVLTFNAVGELEVCVTQTLASGGSRDPMDVFVDFRGRQPDTEPLLRHNGLA